MPLNLDCMLAVYGPYVLMIDEETGAYSGYWEWHNSANLIGIAYGGSQYNEEYDAYIDTFFLLESGGQCVPGGLCYYRWSVQLLQRQAKRLTEESEHFHRRTLFQLFVL